MRWWRLLCVICLCGCSAFAPNNRSSTAEEAARLYTAANYPAAAQLYETLLAQGVRTVDVYFNLGSAYVQSGDFIAALINFERAHRLAPDDEEISRALERLHNQLGVEAIPSYAQIHSSEQVLLLATVVWNILWAALLLFIRFRRRWMRNLLMLASVGFLLILFVLGIQFLVNQQPDAIVLKTTVARLGPDDSLVALENVLPGTGVRVLDQRGDWARVQLPDDSQVWIRVSYLALLDA